MVYINYSSSLIIIVSMQRRKKVCCYYAEQENSHYFINAEGKIIPCNNFCPAFWDSCVWLVENEWMFWTNDQFFTWPLSIADWSLENSVNGLYNLCRNIEYQASESGPVFRASLTAFDRRFDSYLACFARVFDKFQGIVRSIKAFEPCLSMWNIRLMRQAPICSKWVAIDSNHSRQRWKSEMQTLWR